MTDTETGTGTDPGSAPPDADQDEPTVARGRPPLVRRRRGRMVAGVAAGVARHLGIDVTLVRIGFVVLAFIGGTGILAYAAGWVLLPEKHGASSTESWESERGPSFWIGIGLLVVAAIVLVEHTTPFGSGIGTPLVLIAAGVALWKVAQDRSEPTSPPTAGATPTDADTARGTVEPQRGSGWTPPPVPARRADRGRDWTPPPAPPRSRSVLGRVTIAVVLLALGGGAIADQLDLLRFTAADAAATALGIVGVGLLVGTWFGRARGLIVLGIMLVPVVVATSFLRGTGIDVGAGAGERVHVVSTASGLEPEYSLGAGKMELDVSGLEPPGGGVSTAVRLGAGEVRLHVPEDTHVVIDARVQLGVLDLPGVDRAGPGLTERLELGSVGDPGGTLHVDVELGVGELSVRVLPPMEARP